MEKENEEERGKRRSGNHGESREGEFNQSSAFNEATPSDLIQQKNRKGRSEDNEKKHQHPERQEPLYASRPAMRRGGRQDPPAPAKSQ
jgi:hypothetical protein